MRAKHKTPSLTLVAHDGEPRVRDIDLAGSRGRGQLSDRSCTANEAQASNAALTVLTIKNCADQLPDCKTSPKRVYAFAFGDHPVKIGVANNVRRRFVSIRTEHARFGAPTTLVAAAYSVPCYNAKEVEAAILALFFDSRVGGEYVAQPFDVVQCAMQGMEFRVTRTAEEQAKQQRANAGTQQLLDWFMGKPGHGLPLVMFVNGSPVPAKDAV